MSLRIIKPKSTEITASSANTINSATLVRVFNNSATVHLLTLAYANTTTYATLTVAGYGEVFIAKDPTDTIQGTNIQATKIAFAS